MYEGRNGRSGEIRTPGPLVPNQMRYQAALHSDCACLHPHQGRYQALILPDIKKLAPRPVFKAQQAVLPHFILQAAYR